MLLIQEFYVSGPLQNTQTPKNHIFASSSHFCMSDIRKRRNGKAYFVRLNIAMVALISYHAQWISQILNPVEKL